MNCPICNTENIDKKHPYSIHKIKYADFIEKYYPKIDLYTKELIKYKNDEQYHLADFNTKINLKKYLESVSKEEGLHYLKGWLLRRKELKNLSFAPVEFEIKSLPMPSLVYWNKKYGIDSYKKICLELGLLLKHDLNYLPETNQNQDLEYIVDSREQSVLPIKNFQVQCLNYGDYTIKDNDSIYIERKSLSDAISTLSQGYERFNKEIERCKKDNNYLIILIEEKYSNLQSFEYMPHIHSKCDWIFISHRIRELLQNYPLNIQFLAVDGRKEAVRIIEKIFKLKDYIKQLDLQYFYNIGDL